MSIGEGKKYVSQNLIMSASNDQGNAVLNNMGGRCQINRLIDAAAETVESHVYCAYTDADNDQIFEKCDFQTKWKGRSHAAFLLFGHGWEADCGR
jgi:hypothetical protein